MVLCSLLTAKLGLNLVVIKQIIFVIVIRVADYFMESTFNTYCKFFEIFTSVKPYNLSNNDLFKNK